jgi:tRNA (cmo5U34)-methyltransferase
MSVEEMEPTEEMAAFFDARAAGYDDYFRDEIFPDELLVGFYDALSAPIGETDAPLRILDLGCGTGLELEALFQRVPNARVTGVDLAEGMLKLLISKYSARMRQITLVVDSFLTMPLGSQVYDHVLSGNSMHHVLRHTKRELYRKIHAALKPGGSYIEGDSVVPYEMEGEFIAEYHECAATVPPAPDGTYHLDVPFSLETQKSLLLEAGFRDFRLIWQKDPTMVWNIAVYVVTA